MLTSTNVLVRSSVVVIKDMFTTVVYVSVMLPFSVLLNFVLESLLLATVNARKPF